MPFRFAGAPAYRLRWPAPVLRAELRWLTSQSSLDVEAAKLVLQEAFAGDEPLAALVDASRGVAGVGAVVGRPISPLSLLHELLAGLDELPIAGTRSPYWHERQGLQLPVPPDASQPPTAVAPAPEQTFDWVYPRFVQELWGAGYFRQAVPKVCVDAAEPNNDPDFDMDMTLWDLLGVRGLWPLQPEHWNDDTRWALVEALGDLVARPRARSWHNWDACGWHFSQFSESTGQALYRARVNSMLEQSGVPLRLAEQGEDVGRLIRVTDDARQDLIDSVLATSAGPDRNATDHAIALFRSRTADRENKRSAVNALARILEDRRPLLQQKLVSKDEGALFQIANQFDRRHRNEKQLAEYDDAFLDWIFWWYLGTVELSGRLLARGEGLARG